MANKAKIKRPNLGPSGHNIDYDRAQRLVDMAMQMTIITDLREGDLPCEAAKEILERYVYADAGAGLTKFHTAVAETKEARDITNRSPALDISKFTAGKYAASDALILVEAMDLMAVAV